jgi:trans-L-3-hydroxyproline dehydratase
MADPATAWFKWSPGDVIRTVDAHAEGEPLRVIFDGMPALRGNTILERRRFAREHCDALRTALMWEPRGHADMYGCILTDAVSDDADFGVLFLHNEGYSTMCGHGIIAVTTVVLETGLFTALAPETVLRIDTPAGLVTTRATVVDGHVKSVAFENVASFVSQLDAVVDVPVLGHVRYDLAYGGAFYAYVNAGDLGLKLDAQNARQLIDSGMAIKRAIMQSRSIEHPTDPDLGFLYGTIFIGAPASPDSHSRNVCVFADGEVDRSPTGTGVSGRLAIHHARGEIDIGQTLHIESIIGTRFSGRVIRNSSVGRHPAIVPEVAGRAFLTGRHEFRLDRADPLVHGFFIR